jgi:hypothetical protein
MKITRYPLVLFVLFTSLATVRAQIPRAISYQGVLADDKGKPLPDGQHILLLRLYETRTGKIELYSKTDTVTTINGVFSTVLDEIPSSLTFDQQYYLGIQVDNTTPELHPRTPLTSAPYALSQASTQSGSIASVGSADNTIKVTNGNGPNVKLEVNANSIATSHLQGGSVTDAKIASVAWSKVSGVPTSFAPDGPAGGELSGAYPDPVLKPTGVVAGQYSNPVLTIDSKGRITNASVGTGSGFAVPYIGSSGAGLTTFTIQHTTSGADRVAIRGEASGTSSNISNPSAAIVGSNTTTSTSAASYGIAGRAIASVANSAGVYGVHTSNGAGVIGYGHYGVVGNATTSANCVGLYGFAPSINLNNSFAVYGQASGDSINSLAWAGYFTGGLGVHVVGRLSATGSKSAVVPLASTGEWRKLYCEEAAEVYFNDYGSSQLVNGRKHIDLDPIFLETVTIDSAHPMKVFVQPNGDTKGLYVVKGETGFDVIESSGGISSAEFDYRIVATRKGYENVRLEKAEAPKNLSVSH